MMTILVNCCCSLKNLVLLVLIAQTLIVLGSAEIAEVDGTSDLTQSYSPSPRDDLVCHPGLLTKGATFPRGDIYLKEGDTLEVNCTLNLTKSELRGLSAQNIVFNLMKAGKTIPPEHVTTTVVNNATAIFRMTNMTASKPMLGCYVRKPDGKNMTICLNQVDIGYLPKPVENFRCIAKDWASLNCTWTKPYNPISTKYELSNLITKKFRTACPNNQSERANGTEMESCEWNGRTEPHYYQQIDTLVLEMKGSNRLSPNGVIWRYKINHWAIVVPTSPDKVLATSISPHEIQVEWYFALFEHFNAGLVHKVSVCSVHVDYCTMFEYESIGVPMLKKTLQVPYAFTEYRIEVRMKSEKANDTQEFWSGPGIVHTKTLGKKPEFPPETTLGSFETVNKYQSREIYVYWKLLPHHLRNGSDFYYRFEVYENDELAENVKPNEIQETYAVFSNMSLESHRFEIWSVNSEGMSERSSVVSVPSTMEAPNSPLSVSKLVFTNGTYEVSWRPSGHGSLVDSYTVYICNSSRDLPNQCNVLLRWVEVKGSETQWVSGHLGSNNTDYQFAVSANTKSMSSGMISASCEQRYDRVPGKIADRGFDNVSSYAINIKWKLDCSYTAAMVKNFRIMYCPVQATPRYTCIPGKQQVVFAVANASDYLLTKLEPFTKYMITISIVSRAAESQMSDPLFPTTLEAAPSDPPKIESVEGEMTNTTARIKIQPPKILNGVIRSYKITYQSSDSTQVIQVDPKDLADGNFILADLESNTNYSLKASACTVSCSTPSDIIYVKTKHGFTNFKQKPLLTYDDGKVLISWHRPNHVGGPIDHFEVRVKKNGEIYLEDGPVMVEYIQDMSEYMEKVSLKCESNTNVSVQVRAVTKIEDAYLYGDWSPEGDFNCFGNSLLLIWIMVVGSVIFIIVILVTIVSCKRCRNMKKIIVKIPPGIEHFQHLNGFPPQRGRQNSGAGTDTVTYGNGKDNLTYQMQLTSTQPDETKDFLSSDRNIKETPAGQLDGEHHSPEDGNQNLNLEVGNSTFNFEDGKVPLWLWEATKLSPDAHFGDGLANKTNSRPQTPPKVITTASSQIIPPILTAHLRPRVDEENMARLSPSPSNPLLYEDYDDDEHKERHYRDIGIQKPDGGLTFGDHPTNSPFRVDISIPSSLGTYTHPPTGLDQSVEPTNYTNVQRGENSGDGGEKVPDIVTNNKPSYVKWAELRNDHPKVGAPYCQVGILLDA